MDLKNDTNFFVAFRKLFRAYTDFQMDAVKKLNYDLSPNEVVVLANLDTFSTASEIAADFEVSKALVSRSVKLLKQKNLIDVNISEVDKREQTLSLTHEGEKIADIVSEANENFCKVVLKNFENNEKEVLHALLNMMLNNLDVGDLNGKQS